MRRIVLLTTALTFALASVCAPAQDSLPDIGSSADTMLGPAQQREYGQMLLAQLRHYDYILDDPLIDSWLRHMGNRLAEASDQPGQPFTFFMIKDRSVNAFATLGGYIGTNAGLVLIADSEDEVAGVLAHHVHAQGVVPVVNLIASDQRIQTFRHPIPTDKKIERYGISRETR